MKRINEVICMLGVNCREEPEDLYWIESGSFCLVLLSEELVDTLNLVCSVLQLSLSNNWCSPLVLYPPGSWPF